MGLRDELQVSHPGGTCKVRLLLASLDKTTAAELIELIDDPSVTATSLARLARRKGWLEMTGQSFARHRRKDCKCH